MASKKTLSSSAMVDLKAELHRKQEEFRRQKVDYGQNVKGRKVEKVKTKKSIWNQQNQGVSERAKRDVEETQAEEDDLVKSRRMLAHKTKLYEEMTSTSIIPDEDGSEGFLVDFQRKAVDRIVDDREKQREKEEEEREEEAEKKALSEPIPEPADSDDEWVDFTDSFGRSRRCMKKDMGNMKKKDRDLTGEVKSKAVPEKGDNGAKGDNPDPELPHLMSSDMHREKMRQKWEEEERALLDNGQEDIHYSNVQFDEIRSHGVGYYQFSKDHTARQEQLEQLKKMREETETETSRKDKIQAKRKAMMEARLAKVRDRRKLKDGVSADSKSEEDKAKAEAAEKAKKAKEEEERRMKEEAEKEEMEVRRSHLREWDKEKQKDSLSGKGYAETRRNEREAEFAPPSVYFDNKPKTHAKTTTGMTDEMRLNRLKKSTLSRGANVEFAPPSCYFTQDNTNTTSHKNHKREKTDVSNKNTALGSHRVSSESKSLHGNKDPSNSKSSELIGDVCLESIPLPKGDVADGKEVLPDQSESSSSYSKVASDQHGNDTQQTSNVYGNDWHYQQCYQQQQQQQEQQHLQQQQYYTQQVYNDHYTPQPLVNDNAWTTHHQHHPHQQQSYYQQQQEYANQTHQPTQQAIPQPSQQPLQQAIPQPSQQQPHHPPQPTTNTLEQPQKRKVHQTESQKVTTGTKSKVPKSAIMDTRFILNDLPTPLQDPTLSSNTTNVSPSPVEAVPYQPGSFTAARFPQGVPPDDSIDADREPTPSQAQIAGGPQLYSKKQLEEQQQKMEEDSEPGADQKLNDFLASIRAETN